MEPIYPARLTGRFCGCQTQIEIWVELSGEPEHFHLPRPIKRDSIGAVELATNETTLGDHQFYDTFFVRQQLTENRCRETHENAIDRSLIDGITTINNDRIPEMKPGMIAGKIYGNCRIIVRFSPSSGRGTTDNI